MNSFISISLHVLLLSCTDKYFDDDNAMYVLGFSSAAHGILATIQFSPPGNEESRTEVS